jgi:hypothetical protein
MFRLPAHLVAIDNHAVERRAGNRYELLHHPKPSLLRVAVIDKDGN